MEILDLYDENGNLTGNTIVRGQKPKGNLKIKITVVWIKNNNKYLIQKCSVIKGGEWAVTGGHVPTGQSSLSQSIVEVKEELGIDLQKESLKFLGNLYGDFAIFDVYLTEQPIDSTKIVLQTEEVESVKWLTKKQIDNLITKGKMRQSSVLHYQKFIK